jgi:Kef-type K+ transport system membrane component KefB
MLSSENSSGGVKRKQAMAGTESSQAGVEQVSSSPLSLLWTTVAYGLMIVGAVLAIFLICRYGGTLVAPAAGGPETFREASETANVLLHVLVALSAVIITGMALAKCFTYLGQPPVIGEVVAGIVLGPSLLGPQASALILPSAVAPFLGIIAQIGVVLYMFTVGLSLHTEQIKSRARAAVAISHASILLPFLLGSLLALDLYPRLSNRSVPFTSFALFIGVAMSITAFPVLARILTDRRMVHTELGVISVSCAAADDVTAWCLLAFVSGVAKSRGGQGLMIAASTLAYIAFMFLLIRPLLRRLVRRWETQYLSRSAAGFVFVALLLSALATESIGIHAIFGAFLLGAVIPSDSLVARTFTRELESVVTILLLPAFFAFTGMRTRIDLLSGLDQWVICGVIILVATMGKFGGTIVAARVTGLNWRSAAALGMLMNTRGLMELIVLNIGLDLQVISPTLFAMMVLMALATTMVTAPVLRLLIPDTASEGLIEVTGVTGGQERS